MFDAGQAKDLSIARIGYTQPHYMEIRESPSFSCSLYPHLPSLQLLFLYPLGLKLELLLRHARLYIELSSLSGG